MVRVKKQQQLLLLCQPSGIHVHAFDLLESKHCSKAHGTANFSWIFVHETEKESLVVALPFLCFIFS